jgi:hypothetical protein
LGYREGKIVDKKHQNIIVCSAVVTLITVIVLGVLVIQKLERVVQVAERTEQTLNGIVQAASPVGRAAVEKGVSILNSVDDDELARAAEDTVKEVGAVAKGKLLDWMASQQVSPTNSEIPNLNIIINTAPAK